MQKIGFIGQGFIGKHMADDFEERGMIVVRYALEEPYKNNRTALVDCDIVFVAVPTPTTPEGFDDSILRDALKIPKPGAIVVIKSTILPGRTKALQDDFSDLILLHSPEFLREKHAAEDTARPTRTIVGIPKQAPEYRAAAESVLDVLPSSPHQLVCDSTEAELIKYGGNCFLAMKVVYMNMLYDIAAVHGIDYQVVAGAMAADPRIGDSHMQVLDSSGHHDARVGRGAGGHCFPKDFAALREHYEAHIPDDAAGVAALRALEFKNIDLLVGSGKDPDLLRAIYGKLDNVSCEEDEGGN